MIRSKNNFARLFGFTLIPLLAVSCNNISNENLVPDNKKIYSIEGKADFNRQGFSGKATVGQIGRSATVSLIIPPDAPEKQNNIVATGLTSAIGSFRINLDSFRPFEGQVFILEASKRATDIDSAGGSGDNIVTIRTNVMWVNNNWKSITTPVVLINTKTTALSIISNLNPDRIGAEKTIETMPVDNDGFAVVRDLPGKVTADEIMEVQGMAASLLEVNEDPVARILQKDGEYFIRDTAIPEPTPTDSSLPIEPGDEEETVDEPVG